jgi:hypothetical protein
MSLAHIHLVNGRSVRGTMIRHPCNAYMTIYVPVDTTMRLACVVLDSSKPHTHPMPTLAKMSLDIDKIYRRCVRGAGVLGTTVQKVDDGAHFVVLYEFILTTRTLYRSTYNYSPLEGPIPSNVPSITPQQTTKTGHYTFRKDHRIAGRTRCWR